MAKYIVAGSVAGGATAAARLRRLDEGAEIILVERGGDISFANCGLPYYVEGVIPRQDDLLVRTPAKFAGFFMWMCAGAERSHKGGYGSPSGSYSPWGGRISGKL